MIATMNRQTKTRAYGSLTDGTPFEVVKHLGSGRFEIRHYHGLGRGRKYNTLTAEQRALISAHPVAVAIKAVDVTP